MTGTQTKLLMFTVTMAFLSSHTLFAPTDWVYARVYLRNSLLGAGYYKDVTDLSAAGLFNVLLSDAEKSANLTALSTENFKARIDSKLYGTYDDYTGIFLGKPPVDAITDVVKQVQSATSNTEAEGIVDDFVEQVRVYNAIDPEDETNMMSTIARVAYEIHWATNPAIVEVATVFVKCLEKAKELVLTEEQENAMLLALNDSRDRSLMQTVKDLRADERFIDTAQNYYYWFKGSGSEFYWRIDKINAAMELVLNFEAVKAAKAALVTSLTYVYNTFTTDAQRDELYTVLGASTNDIVKNSVPAIRGMFVSGGSPATAVDLLATSNDPAIIMALASGIDAACQTALNNIAAKLDAAMAALLEARTTLITSLTYVYNTFTTDAQRDELYQVLSASTNDSVKNSVPAIRGIFVPSGSPATVAELLATSNDPAIITALANGIDTACQTALSNLAVKLNTAKQALTGSLNAVIASGIRQVERDSLIAMMKIAGDWSKDVSTVALVNFLSSPAVADVANVVTAIANGRNNDADLINRFAEILDLEQITSLYSALQTSLATAGASTFTGAQKAAIAAALNASTGVAAFGSDIKNAVIDQVSKLQAGAVDVLIATDAVLAAINKSIATLQDKDPVGIATAIDKARQAALTSVANDLTSAKTALNASLTAAGAATLTDAQKIAIMAALSESTQLGSAKTTAVDQVGKLQAGSINATAATDAIANVAGSDPAVIVNIAKAIDAARTAGLDKVTKDLAAAAEARRKAEEHTKTVGIIAGSTIGGVAVLAAAAATAIGLGIKHFLDKVKGLKTIKETLNGSPMDAGKLQKLLNMRNSAESMAEYVETLESRLVDLSDESGYKGILTQYRDSIMQLNPASLKLLEAAIIDKPNNFSFSIEVVNALCQKHGWKNLDGKFPTDSHNVDIKKFADALKPENAGRAASLAKEAVTRSPGFLENAVDWFWGTHRTL